MVPNIGIIQQSNMTYLSTLNVLELFNENEKFIKENNIHEYLELVEEKYQIIASEKIKKLSVVYSEKLEKKISNLRTKSKTSS